MSLLMDDAHLYWMDQLGALNAHANKIADLNNIKEQREQFDFLSEVLINSIKVFGLSNQVLYVEYCPMALGNKGANWLSREPEIRNPYFGDKMLKCGLVKDTITKDYKNPQWKKQ